MNKLALLNIFRKELIRNHGIKIFLIIFQISLSVLIFITGINFYIHYSNLNNDMKEMEIFDIYYVEGYSDQFDRIYFDDYINGYSDSPIIDELLPLYSGYTEVKTYMYDVLKDYIPGEILKDLSFHFTAESYPNFFHRNTLAGRYFNQSDGQSVVVISELAAELLFDGIEKSINQYIDFQKYGRVKVIGVIDSGVESYFTNKKDLSLFFPYDFFNMRANIMNFVFRPSLDVSLGEAQDLFSSANRNISIIKYYYVLEDSLMSFRNMAIASIFFSVMLFFISFMGGLGISLSLFIKELRNFGIKMSIGADKKQIYMEIIIKNMFIYLLGCILGLILNYPLKLYIDSIDPLYKSTPYYTSSIIGIITISTIFSLLLSMIVIKKINSYNTFFLLKK